MKMMEVDRSLDDSDCDGCFLANAPPCCRRRSSLLLACGLRCWLAAAAGGESQ